MDVAQFLFKIGVSGFALERKKIRGAQKYVIVFDNRLMYLQKSWKLVCPQNAFFTFSVKHFDKNSESQFEAFSTYAKKQRFGQKFVKTLEISDV